MLRATKSKSTHRLGLTAVPEPPDEHAAHALWVKYDCIGNRLQEIARKADLVAWALQGHMALEENDAMWPLQDAAHAIRSDLETLPEEVRI